MPKVDGNNSPNGKYTPRRAIAIIILLALIVLSFFLLKPFLTAILGGIILAYILAKPYKWLNKHIKKPTASAIIICLVVVIILAIASYFILQITIREAFNLYMQIQKIDVFNLINGFLSNIFQSPDLSRQISLTIQQAITTLTSSFTNAAGSLLINLPTLILQVFIVFFIAFYFLRDGEKISAYFREILPFGDAVNEKILKRSQEVTYATIYGQVVVGVIQGIVAGIGFYIFGAPSPLFFSLIAILLAIIPNVGPAFVWVPVSIFMIATGNTLMGVLLLLFGIIVVSWIDNIVRPYIVGRKGNIHPGIAMVGMIGGLLLMGPVGIVIGPLILEYLLIFIEIYRTSGKKFFE